MKYSLILFFILSAQVLFSQEITLDDNYKRVVIEKLSHLMEDYYIYPEVAKKTSEHLHTQYKDGHFNKYTDLESFAHSLTEAVQSINKDKHMRIRANKAFEAPENTLERKAEERMDQINNYRSFNHGFKELKILEGNVGYLDLRAFAGIQNAKEIADAYMKLMSQADALIIDLSHNGGGDPSMVQYLCSYFFDEKLHLNSLHYREGDRVEEYWTLEEVGGKKMADTPLFVVTGGRTFSGAEEFSYNMQTQKRATLIGQTTGGGANPGSTRGINQDLSVFIPTGRAVNPITNTSWEGVGVIPEIQTTKEATFDKVYSLAKNAAESQRKNKLKKYTNLHQHLNKQLDQYKEGESETNIHNSIVKFMDAGLFGEWDINTLGYEYLYNLNKPKIALSILKSNTVLFPNSANVFDSYGEALSVNGDLNASVEYYQKALDIAIKNEDRNLAYYKDALQKIKEEAEEKK